VLLKIPPNPSSRNDAQVDQPFLAATFSDDEKMKVQFGWKEKAK